MALPKLDTPTYNLKIYNGDIIKYRPFLVKEQKLLLLALEEGKTEQLVDTMYQIISNCTFEKLSVETLPLFEVENIFLRLREKSVGEVVEFKIRCLDEECTGLTPVSLNLTEVTYDVTNLPERSIQITSNTFINMKFPTLKDLESVRDLNNVTDNFNFLVKCIDSIEHNGSVYDIKTTSKDELQDFIESMTQDQFGKINEFFSNLPKVSKKLDYDCVSCGKHCERNISGVQNFLV